MLGQLCKIITFHEYLLSTYSMLSTVLCARDITSIKLCPQLALFYGSRYKHIHFNDYSDCYFRVLVSGAVWLKCSVLGERNEH